MVQSVTQDESQMMAAKKRFHRGASFIVFLFLIFLTPSNIAALMDSDGAIQEGYKYRAHGTVTVLTTDGNDDTWFTADDDTATTSAIGNPYTYRARRINVLRVRRAESHYVGENSSGQYGLFRV